MGTRERPERLQGGRVADLDAPLDEPTAIKRKKTLLTINLFTLYHGSPTCNLCYILDTLSIMRQSYKTMNYTNQPDVCTKKKETALQFVRWVHKGFRSPVLKTTRCNH